MGPLHDIHPAAVFFDTGSFLIYLRLLTSRLPFNLFCDLIPFFHIFFCQLRLHIPVDSPRGYFTLISYCHLDHASLSISGCHTAF